MAKQIGNNRSPVFETDHQGHGKYHHYHPHGHGKVHVFYGLPN